MKIAGHGGRVSSRSAELQLCAFGEHLLSGSISYRAELELRAPDADRRGGERRLQSHFRSGRRTLTFAHCFRQLIPAATARMKFAGLRRRIRLLLPALLLGTATPIQAQSTNAYAGPEYQAFKLIADRNIFDPNRSSRSRGPTEKQVRVESFALIGTMSYDKGDFAFFDGSSLEFKKVFKTGDTIAGYRIAAITSDAVRLEVNGAQTELRVGMQMKREDEGEWQRSARTLAAASATPAQVSGEKSGGESTGGEQSEVLKRLVQQREQEMNK